MCMLRHTLSRFVPSSIATLWRYSYDDTVTVGFSCVVIVDGGTMSATCVGLVVRSMLGFQQLSSNLWNSSSVIWGSIRTSDGGLEPFVFVKSIFILFSLCAG